MSKLENLFAKLSTSTSEVEEKEYGPILDIFLHLKAPGWENIFSDKEMIEEVKDISLRLKDKMHLITPICKNIFRAFELTPLDKVKVVLIGQDPYPGGQAVGLSFSVDKNTSIPASLVNIFKELKSNYPETVLKNHGDLTAWAEEGVLLLNYTLTTELGKRNAHKGLWIGFMQKIIYALRDYRPKCIFVLWGREAEKITDMFGPSHPFTVLTAGDPPSMNTKGTFIGCQHFLKINMILESKGVSPICWNLK